MEYSSRRTPRLIKKSLRRSKRGCSPAELVVHADFYNRKVPVADVESVTRGEARGPRRNSLGRVVQTDIIVFNLVGRDRLLY